MTNSGNESGTDEEEPFWPDDLKMGDCVEFDGHKYEVVGTGPGEATLDRVGDSDVTAEVGRWAITNAVYVELEQTVSQEEFAQSVTRGGDRD